MTDFDIEYARLASNIVEKGARKSNRTGIDTISLTGQTLKVDLSNGKVPLLTTKKVASRIALGELTWMIKGLGTKQYLQDKNIRIWNEWNKPYNLKRNLVTIDRLSPLSYTTHTSEYRDDVTELNEIDSKLKTIWLDIIDSIYNARFNGKRSTDTISPEWLILSNFLKDVKEIPHWDYKKNNWDDFILDTSYYGANHYSPETTVWLDSKEAQIYRNEDYTWDKLTRFELIEEGDLGRVYGVQWRHWRRPDGTEFDQLKDVINQLKNSPDSRRIIISAWNPGELDEMALPPCPVMIQFVVNPDENGDLTLIDAVLTQRSADVFLGLPFDVFSYGVLVHLLARETGLKANSLTWVGGDCHVYENHLEQIAIQLGRVPKESDPKVSFTEGISIFDIEPENIKIEGYESHGLLKGVVAV